MVYICHKVNVQIVLILNVVLTESQGNFIFGLFPFVLRICSFMYFIIWYEPYDVRYINIYHHFMSKYSK